MSMLSRLATMAAAGPVTAPIEFVAAASAQGSALASSVTINKPTGVADGDLLIVFLSANAGLTSYTLPAGWTVIAGNDSLNNGPALYCAYKTAASEGANYTFTCSSANLTLGGSIVAYRNAGIGNNSQAVRAAATVTSFTNPSVTADDDNSVLLTVFAGANASINFGTPTGMSSVASNADATAPSWGVFSQSVNAGPTGERVSTFTSVAGGKDSISLVLTPVNFNANAGPFLISQASTQNPGTNGTLTINKPTGTREGDLMLALVSATGAAATWTGATGWTELVDQGALPDLRIAYKVAGASEGSSYIFNASSGSVICAGTIVTYRNAAYDAVGSIDTGANPLVVSGVTASEDYIRILAAVARAATSVVITGPTSMQQIVTDGDATSPSRLVAQDTFLRTSGASGSRSFTVDSTTNVAGALVAIKPAASYTKYAQYTAINTATANGTASYSVSVNTPACVPGNLLLFVVNVATSTTTTITASTPAGWTLLSGNSTGGVTYQPGTYIFYRVADGTEAASYTSNINDASNATAAIITLMGVNPAAITVGTTSTAEFTTTMPATGVTATANGILLYVGCLANNNQGVPTFTPPSGMTEIADFGFNGAVVDQGCIIAYQEGLSAGATGSKTATSADQGGTEIYRTILVTVGAK